MSVAYPTPLIVCLTTCDPNWRLWQQQFKSLRQQSYRDWVCLVQDDASSPAAYARLKKCFQGDPRFQLRRNPKRLGLYRNFEALLKRVPRSARYVALCDHDDRWYPDKLAKSIAALESSGALLVHTNFHPVDERGRELAAESWYAGAHRRADLEMLSLANFVTGPGVLFRAGLLKQALPFPSGPGLLFQDHWLAMVAMSQGSLAYVGEPQYDYVQHSGNRVGYNLKPPSLWRPGLHLLGIGSSSEREQKRLQAREHLGLIMQRAGLYAGVLQKQVGERLKPGAEEELKAIQAATRSLGGVVRLWLRGLWRGRDFYGIETTLLKAALRQRWGSADQA